LGSSFASCFSGFGAFVILAEILPQMILPIRKQLDVEILRRLSAPMGGFPMPAERQFDEGRAKLDLPS
jgi:hypothetical protein